MFLQMFSGFFETPLKEKDNMLTTFKKWIEARYHDGRLSQSNLEAVYHEDHLHDYSSHGNGAALMPQVPAEEQNDVSEYKNLNPIYAD